MSPETKHRLSSAKEKYLSKDELEAIARIVDGLNLYQVLKVTQVASEQDVRDAFHREAISFHPDRYLRFNDPQMSTLSKRIYARVVDAYRTLSTRQKREDYDKKLNNPSVSSKGSIAEGSAFERRGGGSETVDENAITGSKRKAAPSAAGQRFYKLAQTAFSSKDFQSARMNIQIALNADQGNPDFLQLSQRIEAELRKPKK